MKFNLNNFILRTDSYKLTHWLQYPKGMKKLYSYLEARGGEFEKTLFCLLQYYIKEYFIDVKITHQDIDEAEYFADLHFGTPGKFNRKGWEYIVDVLEGKLPLEIKAVKEGTLVPTHNILMSIESTDENCIWLVNVAETILMKLWYPITISTNSFYRKLDIAKALKESNNEDLSNLLWKLHDFGYRGTTSEEQAGIGGVAHLINFLGTDTVRGILFANNYYDSGVCGFSVPASEHSVACSYGKDHEDEYFLNMITQYPTGLVSIVSDTYHTFNFVRNMSTKYKELILKREGTIVFRPDSGNPVDINAGVGFEENGKYYKYVEIPQIPGEEKVEITRDEHLGLIGILWEIFGGETDKNGYKKLPSQIRLIQGDGIDKIMVKKIGDALIEKKFSTDNIVYGSGGGLLQKFDRDTCKFAIKASYGIQEVDGQDIILNLVKDPFTSKGKKSKAGKLKLVEFDIENKPYTELHTVSSLEKAFDLYNDELEIVYKNGVLYRDQKFDEVREIANKYFEKELNS